MPPIALSLVATLFFFGSTSVTSAAPDREAFTKAWNGGRSLPIASGTLLVWTEHTFPTMTAEEVDASIAALGKEPREAERGMLENQRWLLNSGSSVSTFRLWYLDDRRFRLNEDLPSAGWTPQIDAVVNRDEGWVFAGDSTVTAVDLNRAPAGRDTRIHLDTVRRVKSRLLAGGMGLGSGKLTVQDFRADGASWTASMVVPETDIRFDLSGRYEEDSERFVLTRTRIAAPSLPDTHGTVYEFSDHVFVPLMNRMVAGRFTETNPSGRLIGESELVEISAFEPSEFRAIAALPAADKPDPTRPDRMVKRIDDFRPATAVSTSIDSATGERSREVLATNSARSGGLWIVTGWITLVVLITTFVVTRWRTSRTVS